MPQATGVRHNSANRPTSLANDTARATVSCDKMGTKNVFERKVSFCNCAQSMPANYLAGLRVGLSAIHMMAAAMENITAMPVMTWLVDNMPRCDVIM